MPAIRNASIVLTIALGLAVATVARSQDQGASPAGSAGTAGSAGSAGTAGSAGSAGNSGGGGAATAGGPTAAPTADQMMAAMAKYGTPGAEHERLKAMAGTFDAVVTFAMPGMPEQTVKGKMTNEMILGGRYLRGEYAGEMMGQPFSGVQVFGYDRMKQKYVSSWMDSMSTSMMTAEGTADEAGKAITAKCSYDCPITNSKRSMRQVTTITDNDHHTFETYESGPDGKETKAMTIKYTRAKE
ncbi:MAG TPA: DUF1579 domain-containing protein [Tepidisphaeraceae bacterium]|nr:DUF1579 domain-containing protein [Tepidisphaeraceae bacterium]